MIDWDDFEAWMHEEDYRDSTIRGGVLEAQRLVRLTRAEEPLPARLRWAAYRLERYAKARHMELDEGLVSAVERLREAAKQNRRDNAHGGRRRHKRKRTARSLSDPEWQALWTAVLTDGALESRVIEVLMATGLRVGDALRITRPGLTRALKSTGVLEIEVKGGDEITRYIAGAPKTWGRLLEAWQGNRGATVAYLLVPDGDGSTHAGDAPYKRVARHLARLVEHAGIAGRVHLHRLRRTVAVQALRLTDDVQAVQQLLGHGTSAATAAYIDEARPERVAELQRQLGHRFRNDEEDQ